MKSRIMLGMAVLLIGTSVSAQTDTTVKMGRKDTTGNTGQTNTTGQMGQTGGMMENIGTMSKVGNMTVEAFNAANAKGAAAVNAITPTSAKLSAADKALFMKVAAGGQRQLALSQAIVDNATDPQVKMLAASEVEEQTTIGAKLKEMADAKGLTLPEGPDAAAQAMATKAQGMTAGNELDAFYINEGGIKGHQLLQATMNTVNATAKDASLKKLAAVTLPVIKTHLTVSQQVKTMMGTGMKSKAAMK